MLRVLSQVFWLYIAVDFCCRRNYWHVDRQLTDLDVDHYVLLVDRYYGVFLHLTKSRHGDRYLSSDLGAKP